MAETPSRHDELRVMNGLFWLPEDPDNRVPGTLTLDPAEGLHLRLIGALGREPNAVFGADKDMPRILGEADGKYLTLVDCHEQNFRGQLFSTTPTQNIGANYAFIGARFDPPEEIAFSKMFLGLEDLTAWIGRSGISESHTVNENRFDRHVAEGSRLADEEISLDGYTLKLWHQVYWQPTEFREGTLYERHRFSVVPDKVTEWRHLMKIAGDLSDLLSAAFHYPTAFDALCFEIPNAPRGHLIEMHAQWHTQLGTRDKPPRRMTFTFDDLGGVEGVARWLTMANTHRRAISRITATRREGRMYVEDRLMNCVAAAEGVQRKHIGGDASLAQRLKALVSLAGEEFKSAMPMHETWVSTVKKERVEHAHHLDERIEREDPWLFYLGTSTYWLVLMCLLRIADAPKAVERVAACEQFDWDLSHLRNLMDKSTTEPEVVPAPSEQPSQR